MARGISIKDVENKVQHISDNNVIPLSTGADVPEVVTIGVLKEHINEDIDTALEGKQDVINDLATIRSGAALGATALQSYTESDPTVPAWAKAAQKPSYSYSEITGKPTLSTVATSGSYNDLTNKPTIPTVPTNVSAFTNDAGYLTQHQDISGKANSEDLAAVAFSGDYNDLSNKPTIPTVPTNVSAFTNDAGYITGYTETDPTVPSWAKASTKPSYTASEVGALPDTTVIPTESTVSGWGFTKNAGTITGITMNSTSKGTSGVVDLGTVITSHQDISGKEDKSNKVTSLSASSTDTEYPSAKCVWDLVGDIETILASI